MVEQSATVFPRSEPMPLPRHLAPACARAGVAVLLAGLLSAPVQAAPEPTGAPSDRSASGSPVFEPGHHQVQVRAARATAVFEQAKRVFQGGDPSGTESATLLLRDLRLMEDALTREQRSEVANWRSAQRPGNATSPVCARNATIVVHCDRGVRPQGFDAADVLRAFARAHTTYLKAGYRAPLRDAGGKYGGDRRLDVYISDLGPGYYGLCSSDQPRKKIYHGDAMWAYCKVNADYGWQQATSALQAMRVTAAHEYFHAVQYAYDFTEDDWLLEATATWAEDEVFDGIDDNHSYLGWSPIAMPQRPMGRFGDIHYGTWVFFRYLAERFPSAQGGLATVVRDILRRTASGRTTSVQAIQRELVSRGAGGFADVFAAFSDATRRPAREFAEGRDYPVKPTAGSARLEKVGARKRYVADGLRQLTSRTYVFTPGRRVRGGDVRLALAVEAPGRVEAPRAVVSVYRSGGTVTTRTVELSRRGSGRLAVDFSSADVRRVEVTVANASSRMRACFTDYTSGWSCYGKPRYNAHRTVVTGTVVRR